MPHWKDERKAQASASEQLGRSAYVHYKGYHAVTVQLHTFMSFEPAHTILYVSDVHLQNLTCCLPLMPSQTPRRLWLRRPLTPARSL